MRERILKGAYTEHPVKTVHFVEQVPKTCTIDGDELIDIKPATFEMYAL